MEGTPFGRYRLIELLGRGGMGEVWRAHDTDTDRIVAIKVLPAHFSDNEDFKKRFRREAHAAARLNTPHAVPIHHYGEIDGRLYLDMRLIEGRDLPTVLADGPMEPSRAVRIIEGIALALHAAHKVGLVHRDVKPSNILLDENDFAYLIDFGIARAADETRLTTSGNAIGTFHYIAPERLGTRAEEDARADIYSLACVLYECLTGRPPFDEATMAGLVAAHLNAPPPQPSATQPNLPAQFDEVIATGMAKDPDNRYATTVELANAARDAITTPIPAPAQNLRPPPASLTNRAPPAPATEPAGQQHPNLHLAATQQRPPGSPRVPPTRPADRAPPQTGTLPRRRWWRRQAIMIPAALLTVAVIAAAIVITSQQHENSNSPQITLPTSTQHREPAYGPQVTLPFTGLNDPSNVAVDTAGNVYVTDNNARVLKLPAGSNTQVELPFVGLKGRVIPVAVDTAGNVYVAPYDNARVLKLSAGSTTQVELSFTGLTSPTGVAVDTTGDVYVADYLSKEVLKLPAGSTTPVELPVTGLNGPSGVAVDTAGNVYVTEGLNHRVLRLPAGSTTQVDLPFVGLTTPHGVAVDTAGNVYVTDSLKDRVLKLPAGSTTQVELPFTGLNRPKVKDLLGVAVDSTGNVYVTDGLNNRVLKLPAG